MFGNIEKAGFLADNDSQLTMH